MAVCLASGSLRAGEGGGREARSPQLHCPGVAPPAPSMQLRDRLLSGELSDFPGRPPCPSPPCYLPANKESLRSWERQPSWRAARAPPVRCLEGPQQGEGGRDVQAA